MFDRDVIGHSRWTRGFLCQADVEYLETLDAKRSRNSSSTDPSSYEQMVEDDAEGVATHCEHGIPLNERCAMCQGFHV